MNIYWIFIIAMLIMLIVGIAIIINITTKKNNKVSFKESFDLTGLPIITFYSNNIKLNFILDTGSTSSHINKSVLKSLKTKKCNYTDSVFGLEGNSVECDYYEIPINYKSLKFIEEFSATDLSSAFKAIKKETGVQLHGILGSKFFEKRKYVLDFKELIAYIKK